MKIGVVGSGMIVPVFLDALEEALHLTAKAICGRKESFEKVNRLKESYQIEQVYWDYNEMLANGELDVIYVALPNSLHYEYAKKALLCNKHVIVEKPFTSNSMQAEELIALARARDLFLFEAVSTIANPNFRKVNELLPHIGKLRIAYINYSQYSSRYDDFQKGIIRPAFDAKMSGGALMDLGVYNIHFLVGLFGKPKQVGYQANVQREIDTSGILTMSYEDFQCVSIASKDSDAPCGFTLQGEEGCLYADTKTNELTAVNLRMRDGTVQHFDLRSYQNRLCDEIRLFYEMYQHKDLKTRDELLRNSWIVMQILEEAGKES